MKLTLSVIKLFNVYKVIGFGGMVFQGNIGGGGGGGGGVNKEEFSKIELVD